MSETKITKKTEVDTTTGATLESEAKDNVTLKKTAKGEMSWEISCYDFDADKALIKAVSINEKLEKEYNEK